jgi:hypothetical protein
MKWKMCKKGVKGCPLDEPDARACPWGYIWVDEHDDYILNCISHEPKPLCLIEEKFWDGETMLTPEEVARRKHETN